MPVDYKNDNEMSFPSRSSRNSKLYREVYGKYDDLDNLPIEDNTDEIDMEKLRELVYNNESFIAHRGERENLDVIDIKKRNFDRDRMYDINQILEKAKYENNKLKDSTSFRKSHNNLLSTLQLEKVNYDDEEDNIVTDYKESDNMYMTREFKFKELNDKISELNSNPLIDNVMSDNELSFSLFEDLKPDGNTITTKPIVDSSDYKGDMHSSDTKDIDIIKPISKESNEEFFTSSYEFSKKDFNIDDQDEIYQNGKMGSNVFKIILLLLAILSFSFVIVYFILTYGIGV